MQMSLLVAPSQQKETTKIHMHWSISQQTKKMMKQIAGFQTSESKQEAAAPIHNFSTYYTMTCVCI